MTLPLPLLITLVSSLLLDQRSALGSDVAQLVAERVVYCDDVVLIRAAETSEDSLARLGSLAGIRS